MQVIADSETNTKRIIFEKIFRSHDCQKYEIIINMNPKPTTLFCQVKNHKENEHIRPVVSYINGPTKKFIKCYL